MKRKIMLITALVLCIVLVLLLASCFGTTSSKSTSNQPTVSDRVTSLEKQSAIQDKSIAALEKSVSSIPAMGDVNTAVSTANSAKSSVNDLKADVESITTELDKLKKRVAELEAGNEDTNSNNDSDTKNAGLIDSDRSLELYLDKMNPDSDPFHLTESVNSVTFDLIVKNTDKDHHDFILSLWVKPEDPCSIDTANSDVTAYSTLGDWTVTTDTPTAYDENKVYFTMDDEGFIQDKDSDKYTVAVTVAHDVKDDNDTFWSFRWTIEETD